MTVATLTSGTSWQVPAGVTTLQFEMEGCGGAGGSGASGGGTTSGCGGGGGGYCKKLSLSVTPLDIIALVFGTPGVDLIQPTLPMGQPQR